MMNSQKNLIKNFFFNFTELRVLISDIFLLRNVIVGLAAQKRTTMMMKKKKHEKANAKKKE